MGIGLRYAPVFRMRVLGINYSSQIQIQGWQKIFSVTDTDFGPDGVTSVIISGGMVQRLLVDSRSTAVLQPCSHRHGCGQGIEFR